MKNILFVMMLTFISLNGGFLDGVNAANQSISVDMQVRESRKRMELEQRLTEAKIREIEARTARQNKKNLSTSSRHKTKYAPNIPLDNNIMKTRTKSGNTIYKIRGNSEECTAIFTKDGNLYDTTCLSLINSKGTKILCTKHKKICKTENELIVLINDNYNNILTTDKGTNFKVTYNKDGAILNSKSFTIYLGNKCDASSPQFGQGSWRDGRHMGFSIQFIDKDIVFSGQQLLIQNNAGCI